MKLTGNSGSFIDAAQIIGILGIALRDRHYNFLI
ncbi:MAG: hypothetical protein ACI83P_002225 [Janthinobacterium sp.]|jgi:hypothetical protein